MASRARDLTYGNIPEVLSGYKICLPDDAAEEACGPPDAYCDSGLTLGGSYAEPIGDDAIERAGGIEGAVAEISYECHEIVRDLWSNC